MTSDGFENANGILVRPSIPILFFGDDEEYARSPLKVITVGLNPSRLEFPRPLPFLRFPAARQIDPNRPDVDAHLASLRAYFREQPVPGRYLEADAPQSDELVLWGEWEAQSRVVRTYPDPPAGWPRFLYEPYYTLDAGPPRQGRQNTDPFVFGDLFLYTGCLQHNTRGATQLRFLDRGSIILFGSCRERQNFVVDTVFVVDRWIDHDQANQQTPEVRDAVSTTYGDVTLDPWSAGDVPADRSHRMYFGATPESPVDSMFSFFPCLPARLAESGFARPEVRIDGRITPHLNQGKKMTPSVQRRSGARTMDGCRPRSRTARLEARRLSRTPETGGMIEGRGQRRPGRALVGPSAPCRR